MAIWFLANFGPAVGTFFGFAEAAGENLAGQIGASTIGGVSVGPAPQLGGFNQGSWFNGGRSQKLLIEEFREHIALGVIEEAASLFGGLWQLRRPNALDDRPNTANGARAVLPAALDAFETLFRAFAPEHGGIGHNAPPETSVTVGESETVLRAVADLRLAVLPGADSSVLNTVWSGVSDIIAKIGAWALEQVGVFFDNFTPAAGKAFGIAAPLLLASVVLWCAGASVSDLIILATKLVR